MKKFALALIACVAMVQSVNAGVPPLIESLLELDAITSAIGAPSFETIPINEYIVDIKRVTDRITILGEVKYIILTRCVNKKLLVDSQDPISKDHHHLRLIKYIVTLDVALNSEIGSNIVTVLSIDRVNSH